MSIESVSQIESDLGITQADTEVLKGVRLVWQKLQKLRMQAAKDDKQLAPYREMLTRTLEQARAQQAPVEDDQVEQQSQEFWKWYEDQCAAAGVSQLEAARGMHHMAWCEKWLSASYLDFEKAIGNVVNMPSQLHFEDAKAKATALLQAYVGAITKGR
jgi:hypothetical protein